MRIMSQHIMSSKRKELWWKIQHNSITSQIKTTYGKQNCKTE